MNEQDERGALSKKRIAEIVAEFYEPGDGDTEHAYLNVDGFTEALHRAASTSANVDRFDPYRLKVAEECCERLMSACTDAGCPDGVRMDDWIRENVRSTSANMAQGAEAVGEMVTRYTDMGYPYRDIEWLKDKPSIGTKLYTIPPAQTATTDDARDAARYRWIRDGEKDVFCVIGSNGPWGECGHQEIYDERLDDRIDAALTAAQSASGDHHADKT